jgi:hypothetical protein
MKTLTTPIPVTYGVTEERKWWVTSFVIRAEDPTGKTNGSYVPNASVWVAFRGNNENRWGALEIVAYDTDASQCISVNAAPSASAFGSDQLIPSNRVCPGAYTAVAAAANSAGTLAAKKRAIEDILVSANLMDAAFAGT